MTLSITFDYSLDTSGFFDSAESRAALEAAAALWTDHINDDFASVPVGAQFTVSNPSTGVDTLVTTTAEIDDILVYAGAAASPFNRGTSSDGIAGPDGYDLAGTIYNARISNNFNGQGATNDFEPWAGSVSFATGDDWHFGIDTAPAPGQRDFLAIAVHELGHILGIGTTGTFDKQVTNDHFVGANVLTLSADGVDVTDDHGHFEQGGPIDTIMFPTTTGLRSPQALDFATLADLGFDVSFPGSSFTTTGEKFPIETAGADQIIGTDFDDVVNALGGADIVQGGKGNDTIDGGAGTDQITGGAGNDTLNGGADNDQVSGGGGMDIVNGGAGNDILLDEGGGAIFDFAPSGGNFGTDQVIDFDVATDFIRFGTAVGFASAQEAFDGITRTGTATTGGLFTEIVTASGTVQVFSPTALTVDNFQIKGAGTQVPGSAGDDRLTNSAADEVFEGMAGRDTVVFSGSRSAVNVSVNGDTIVATGPQGTDTFTGIERFEFSDGALVFDIPDALPITFQDGSVLNNYAYPLYAASLARAPDEAGLAFWSNIANTDTIKDIAFDASLGQTAAINAQVRLAAEFVTSAEFNTPDTQTTDGFVRKLYVNFLDRDPPDQEGLEFWTGIMNQRLNDEIGLSRLPDGITIFDGASNQSVAMTTEQWAKAWMLRDFASDAAIFGRIEDDVSNGLYVADVNVI